MLVAAFASFSPVAHARAAASRDPVDAVPLPAGALGYPSRAPDLDALPGFQNPPPGYGEVPFWWWSGEDLDTGRLMFATRENYLYGCTLLNLHGLYYSTYGSHWEWAPPCHHFRMPYWAHMDVFLKYFERLSFLLSQGHLVADVAVVYPVAPYEAEIDGDKAKGTAFALAQRLMGAGISFEFIDHDSLARAAVEGDRLVVKAAGARYQALAVPNMAAVREPLSADILVSRGAPADKNHTSPVLTPAAVYINGESVAAVRRPRRTRGQSHAVRQAGRRSPRYRLGSERGDPWFRRQGREGSAGQCPPAPVRLRRRAGRLQRLPRDLRHRRRRKGLPGSSGEPRVGYDSMTPVLRESTHAEP